MIKINPLQMSRKIQQLHLTERIWLRYASRKFPLRGTSDTLGTVGDILSKEEVLR